VTGNPRKGMPYAELIVKKNHDDGNQIEVRFPIAG